MSAYVDTDVARLLVECHRLKRYQRVTTWLMHNGHDDQLMAILDIADERRCLDELFYFLDWAIDRRLLMPMPPPVNNDGDLLF